MIQQYMIIFRGRKKGAIGVFYEITAIRAGENKLQAIESLEKDFELFMWPKSSNIIQLKKGEKK